METLKQQKPVKGYEISEDAYFYVDSHMRKCNHLEMSLRRESFFFLLLNYLSERQNNNIVLVVIEVVLMDWGVKGKIQSLNSDFNFILAQIIT